MSEEEVKKLFDKEIKRKSRLKKLELNMQLLNRRIKELEEKELSMNAMQDESDYTLCEKYKSRLIQVWKIHCKLSKQKAQLGRNSEQTFVYEGTKYMQINRTITHLINKYNYFPDYCDVVELVTKCNSKFNLNISKTKIQILSRRVFEEVGKTLKARRIKDYKEEFGCHLTDSIEEDPADKDMELRKKLERNKKLAHQKLNQVFSYYAEKEKESSEEEEEEEEEDDEEAEEVEEINEAGDNNYIVDEVIKNENDNQDNNTDDHKENNSNKDKNNIIQGNNNNDSDDDSANKDTENNTHTNFTENNNNVKDNISANGSSVTKNKSGMRMIVITDNENEVATNLITNIENDKLNNAAEMNIKLNDGEDLGVKSDNEKTYVRRDVSNIIKAGVSDTEVDYGEKPRSPNVSFVSLGSLMEEFECTESDDEKNESSDGLVESDSLDECSLINQKGNKKEHFQNEVNDSCVEMIDNQTKTKPSSKSFNKIHSNLIKNDLVDDDIKTLKNVARVADNLIFLDSETILRPCYVSIHSLMFDLTNYVKEKLKNKCACEKIKGEKRKIIIKEDNLNLSANTKRLKTSHMSSSFANEKAEKLHDSVKTMDNSKETSPSCFDQDNLSKNISDNKKAVLSTPPLNCAFEDSLPTSTIITEKIICSNSDHSKSIIDDTTKLIPSDSITECSLSCHENLCVDSTENELSLKHDKSASPVTERVIGEIVCLANSDEEDNKNKIAKILDGTTKTSQELKNLHENIKTAENGSLTTSTPNKIIPFSTNENKNESCKNKKMEVTRENDLVVLLDDEESLSSQVIDTPRSTSNPVIVDPYNATTYRRSIDTVQKNSHNDSIEVENRRCHACLMNVCVCGASSKTSSVSEEGRINNDNRILSFKKFKRATNHNVPGLNLTPRLRKEIERVTNLIFKQNNSQVNSKSRYQLLKSSCSQNQFSQEQNHLLRENFDRNSVEYGFNKRNPKVRRSLMMSERYNSFKHGYGTNGNYRQRALTNNRDGDENYVNSSDTANKNYRNKLNNLNYNRIPYKSYSVIETHSRRTSVNVQDDDRDDFVLVNEHPQSIDSNGFPNNYTHKTKLQPVDDHIVAYNTKSDTIVYSYQSDNNTASSSGIDSSNFVNKSNADTQTFDNVIHHASSRDITMNQLKNQTSVNNVNTFAIAVSSYQKKSLSKVQVHRSFGSTKNVSSISADDCFIYDVEPDVPTSEEHTYKYEAISTSMGAESTQLLHNSNQITILD